MAERTIQRFYKTATATRADDGYAVTLDGRPVKTPGTRADLVVPTAALARAVAGEWDAQGETVRPADMPLTALACTALDTVRTQREALIEALVRYGETDLVCYRVPAPAALAERQQALWQPLLDWAALTYDARLDVTTGILPARQPPAALQALREAVRGYDDMRLAAVSAAVRAAGSLILALALVEGRMTAADAFEAAELEATFQIEQWGEDAEAQARRRTLAAELEAVERFVRALGP